MLVIDLSPHFEVFKAHCATMGIPDSALVHIESLPKPPRVPREAKTATTDEINYINVSDIDADTTQNRRYFNNCHWWKKPNTFNGAETYYYVDFYYNDQQWKGKTISDEMDAILRFLKTQKKLDGVTTIWGINKKNEKLLKVGNWVNIVDLAEAEMKKDKVREVYEQNLYLLGLSDIVSRLSNVRRILADTTLLANLEDKTTIKRFKALVSVGNDINAVHSDTMSLTKTFGVKAKMHTSPDVDPRELEKLIKERYFNVFGFVDHYSTRGTDLARLINFIDSKS